MTTEFEAYVADAREAYRLYETMTSEALLDLRAAFDTDAARATTPESIAFAAGRLALIAAVLKARPPAITCPLCHRVSYNLNDIAQRYCGACHRYHLDDPKPTPHKVNTDG